MVNDWSGVSDFMAEMSYWIKVQRLLVDSGEKDADRALLFEMPYFESDRLMIPNGLANSENSEYYWQYSIYCIDRVFAIVRSGRERGVIILRVLKVGLALPRMRSSISLDLW